MSIEDNKRLVRAFWEALGSGRAIDLTEGRYAPDFTLHDSALAGEIRGVEGLQQYLRSVQSAFPDARYVIDDLVAEGDKVVQWVTLRGTHQGEFQGMPPSGRPVAIRLAMITRIVDGWLVECWQLFDSLSLLLQTGVIPPPDQLPPS